MLEVIRQLVFLVPVVVVALDLLLSRVILIHCALISGQMASGSAVEVGICANTASCRRTAAPAA